jgi:hypothetical protein
LVGRGLVLISGLDEGVVVLRAEIVRFWGASEDEGRASKVDLDVSGPVDIAKLVDDGSVVTAAMVKLSATSEDVDRASAVVVDTSELVDVGSRIGIIWITSAEDDVMAVVFAKGAACLNLRPLSGPAAVVAMQTNETAKDEKCIVSLRTFCLPKNRRRE